MSLSHSQHLCCFRALQTLPAKNSDVPSKSAVKQMGDCGICLTADFDGTSEFFAGKVCKARKQHKCCECDKDIQTGEEYEYTSGKSDGEFWTARTCLICRK